LRATPSPKRFAGFAGFATVLALSLSIAAAVLFSAPSAPAMAATSKAACRSSSAAHPRGAHIHTHTCAQARRRRRARVGHRTAARDGGRATEKTGAERGAEAYPPAAVTPALCEDGTDPIGAPDGSFSCDDGSEPTCEAGLTAVSSSEGSGLVCEVAQGPESSEPSCEDTNTLVQAPVGPPACEEGSEPSCATGSADGSSGSSSPICEGGQDPASGEPSA
jgi:hypothetical protein